MSSFTAVEAIGCSEKVASIRCSEHSPQVISYRNGIRAGSPEMCFLFVVDRIPRTTANVVAYNIAKSHRPMHTDSLLNSEQDPKVKTASFGSILREEEGDILSLSPC